MAREQSAMDIYNQALQKQQSLYNEINQGYGALMQEYRQGRSEITGGYNRLMSTVMGGIGNIGRAQATAIADQYTALSGQQSQQMVNRGLGNTTVQQSVQRGVALDKAKADVELQDRIAQTQAQYASNIGLAGLGFQGQSLQGLAGLGSNQLSTAAGMSGGFANIYGGMASYADRQEQIRQQQFENQWNRIYGAAGQAAQISSQNAGRSEAMGLQRELAGQRNQLEYARMGQQGALAQGQLGLQEAALAQRGEQFDATMDYNYDRYINRYGVGAPSSYSQAPSYSAGSSSQYAYGGSKSYGGEFTGRKK
jgi:hypothetical protein